jgi:SAM-dependent methyltransferase
MSAGRDFVGSSPEPVGSHGSETRATGVSRLSYGVAIFVAAFLLFQVEPLIAKMILPWFGGVAAVWTVCLLFFQAALLLGYTYAHLLTRLPVRMQAVTHITLLAASLLTLPIVPSAAWKPAPAADPSGRILLLLTVTIGAPFVLLSATSPLLQAWYHRRTGARPYRLYAVSNAGSMLALLSFPTLFEPAVRAHTLAIVWSFAYVACACMCAGLAWALRRPMAGQASGTMSVPSTTEAVANGGSVTVPAVVGRPSALGFVLWLALAACGSALLLAITGYISQNLAAVPLLWVLPLALYLLSFILAFAGLYRRWLFLRLLGVALGALVYGSSSWFEAASAPAAALIPLFCGALFLCCMFCHGEIARLQPDPRHLTAYYLLISLGGAVGALFVALIAPRVFSTLAELPIAIGACAVLAVIAVVRDPSDQRPATSNQPWRERLTLLAVIAVAAAILISLVAQARRTDGHTRLRARNFYGVLRVDDQLDLRLLQQQDLMFLYQAPDPRYRELVNGAVNHGIQLLMPSLRRRATTYYAMNSGAGIALTQEGKRGPLRVGVIGLGAGTLAAYARPQDTYRFYEINPLVIQIARHEFSFITESPGRIDIIPGDARLSLEAEPPQQFDVLAVDAFSGDSIPVHLLTREAFQLYFRHLKPGGVLAVHVSNRYLDLAPVVRGAAEALGKHAVVVESKEDEATQVFSSTWVLVSAEELPYEYELLKRAEIQVGDKHRVVWTDDYSSIFPLLK